MSTDKKKKSSELATQEEAKNNDSELSDLEEADDSEEIDSDVETESDTDVIDFTSDKLYQVLSGFFEAEDGTTITDAILHLTNRLDRQNDILKHIAKQLVNMTPQKTLQTMGRIGRNKHQQDYSIRFRDNNMIHSLFQRPSTNIEADNINRLFAST